MKYLSKIIGLACIIAATGFASCSDDNEDLVPGLTVDNFFAPDPADNSEEARMRRDFYKENGIYLLFSDTLATYIDSNGLERVETVDFKWTALTSHDVLTTVTYDKIFESERQASVDWAATYFLPYIKDGKMKPYSILLVDNLMVNTGYSPKKAAFYNTWRCFTINMSDTHGVEGEEAKSLGKTMLRNLVDQKLTQYSPELADFFAVCEEYYEADIIDFFPDWAYEQDIEQIYNIGFLKYNQYWGDDPEYDYMPYRSHDLTNFKDAVFNEDEAEFREKWAEYPIIIQKYDLLLECFENLGVNLKAVQ
ncbi:hypothetical protein [uncultured Duncaniella sp.]|uniref:hypothetical protein n=1 Tax=uncultured Duncaniella sp. TaxID=2768039 RepID=UPI0025D7E37A|nr:hypothetical protein [uncultured Duncaniella sp.]